jgi:hypothetical protein
MACTWAQGPQAWQFPAAQKGMEENKACYKALNEQKGEYSLFEPHLNPILIPFEPHLNPILLVLTPF